MTTEMEFYKTIFYVSRKDLERLINDAKVPKCFLALAYAICGEKEKAKDISNEIVCFEPDQDTLLSPKLDVEP
jgi:hypothetical protein